MTLTPGRRWGDPPSTSGPWPTADAATIRRATTNRRPVYGRVYELFTDRPDLDGDHPYVGKTTTTIAKRVRRHKSADDIRADPWKARIVDGPGGYRLLETVYSCGDCAEDERALRRAEAFWIDRIRPTHNDVRPVRPRPGDPLPPRPRDARPARRRLARTRRPFPWRAALFLALSVTLSAVAWRLTAALALPWPWAPWAAAPVAGVPLAWRLTVGVLAKGRRLKVWR